MCNIVGVFVHGLGISPEVALVCSKPRLRPLVHGGGIAHHQALLVLVPQSVGCLVHLGDGAAIDQFLPAI